MNSDQKPSFEEYIHNFKSITGFDLYNQSLIRSYDLNITNAKTSINDNSWYIELTRILSEASDSYENIHKSELLMPLKPEITLVTKSYNSTINKSYRLNILENDAYPNPPEDGWITPENWYYRLDDLIRCRVVCKFVDGLRYVSDAINAHSSKLNVPCKIKTHERDRGYYAIHAYVQLPAPMLPMLSDGKSEARDVNLTIEIQLITQLQDVLYKLTHNVYEEQRLLPASGSAWKWEFNTARFKAGYMAHTLHLLEAIILDIRDFESDKNVSNE